MPDNSLPHTSCLSVEKIIISIQGDTPAYKCNWNWLSLQRKVEYLALHLIHSYSQHRWKWITLCRHWPLCLVTPESYSCVSFPSEENKSVPLDSQGNARIKSVPALSACHTIQCVWSFIKRFFRKAIFQPFRPEAIQTRKVRVWQLSVYLAYTPQKDKRLALSTQSINA